MRISATHKMLLGAGCLTVIYLHSKLIAIAIGTLALCALAVQAHKVH